MSWTKETAPCLSILTFAAVIGNAEPLLAQEMTPSEIKAIQQSGAWQTGRGVVTPGADGKIVFQFGQSQPSLICAPPSGLRHRA